MVKNLASNPQESKAALQAAAAIVDGILAETGNATEHMSDDDAALLREVISLIESSIYGSMDAAHTADENALADGVAAVEACNADISDRQSTGDLAKLKQDVSDDQTELNRLQGVVDDETSNNASAWDTFDNHMQMINAPPACPAFPSRTMPALDVYFEKSEYSLWFAHQAAAYADAKSLYVAADAALTAAIEAYNIQKAIRDTQYCDWKVELEAACASFDACYAEKSDDFNKRLVPRVQSDMDSRIEALKAGETLIHQIKFLLADVANQETPDIDTSRYALDFPTLPPKGQCDLTVLDDAKWTPTPSCDKCNAIAAGGQIDLSGAAHFKVTTRITTNKAAGTIFAKAFEHGLWKNGGSAGQGKMLFLRGGKLCFDIGWVGVVCGKTRLDNGAEHEVALEFADGKYHVLVAGKREGSGLRAVKDHAETEFSVGKSIGHRVTGTEANGDMAPAFEGTIGELCVE